MEISKGKKLVRYASPAYLEAHALRNIQYRIKELYYHVYSVTQDVLEPRNIQYRIKELYYHVYSVTQDVLDLAYKNCKGE